MKYKHIIYNNESYRRITARKAINILQKEKNASVFVLPINADPNSKSINGFFEVEVNHPYSDYIDAINQIREIAYYNCVDELGSYLKYYIKD